MTLFHALTQAFGFNPRTRVGCDNFENGNPSAANVSIHAPVWGATFDINNTP